MNDTAATLATPTGLEGIKPLNVESDPPMTDEEMDSLIPVPVGYHILVAMPKREETFESSSIIKTKLTRSHENILNMVGMVLDMGPQAYGDPERFPHGPWCEAGDYVMFRANSGTRFLVGGQEYRIMNDDSIEAKVKNPDAICNVGMG